jgi:hypothetical protein
MTRTLFAITALALLSWGALAQSDNATSQLPPPNLNEIKALLALCQSHHNPPEATTLPGGQPRVTQRDTGFAPGWEQCAELQDAVRAATNKAREDEERAAISDMVKRLRAQVQK